jgi:hypothetical protein
MGATYGFSTPIGRLECGTDAVLSLLLLRGLQFPSNTQASSIVPGVDLGARLLLLSGRWRPWLGVWGTLWLRQEMPQVAGLQSTDALPQVEGSAGLGLSWGTF